MFAYCMYLRALGRDNASSRKSQKISQPGPRASQPTSHCVYIYIYIYIYICNYIRVACPSIVFAAVLAPYVDPRAGLNMARLARISNESNVSDHSACWWLCVPIVFFAARPMRV